MPYLWFESDGAWVAGRLGAGGYDLAGGRSPVECRSARRDPSPGCVRLLGWRGPAGHERWALVGAGGGIRVNGEPLWLGLRLLRDRDEIRLGPAARVYFSAERLAEVVPFPSPAREVHCPRCHQIIVAGSPAVACPGCQTWHHATAGLPCWTYDQRCAMCPQATALDAGLSWSPQ